jgi:hypothetical protein
MRYYVKEEGVDMAIKDWKDDWRVLVLIQEMPADKETNLGKEQTLVEDKTAPKNPNHRPTQQNKGGAPEKGI